MQTATITDLRPDGRPPYNSPNGTLYGFVITFDDNRSGLCNSKSQTPPYRIGDTVGYEVTGNFQGKDKLKVTKNPPPQFAPPAQPQRAAFQAGNAAPPPARPQQWDAPARGPEIEPMAPVFGATVGMAMNQAIQVLTSGMSHDDVVGRIITPEFWYSVHEVASDVIRVARELEKGRLAPSPTERQKRATGFKTASTAHPNSHPDLEAADSSVPF